MGLPRQVSTVESCWQINNSNKIRIFWASTPSSRAVRKYLKHFDPLLKVFYYTETITVILRRHPKVDVCIQISSEQMRLKQIVGGERLVIEWVGECFKRFIHFDY